MAEHNEITSGGEDKRTRERFKLSKSQPLTTSLGDNKALKSLQTKLRGGSEETKAGSVVTEPAVITGGSGESLDKVGRTAAEITELETSRKTVLQGERRKIKMRDGHYHFGKESAIIDEARGEDIEREARKKEEKKKAIESQKKQTPRRKKTAATEIPGLDSPLAGELQTKLEGELIKGIRTAKKVLDKEGRMLDPRTFRRVEDVKAEIRKHIQADPAELERLIREFEDRVFAERKFKVAEPPRATTEKEEVGAAKPPVAKKAITLETDEKAGEALMSFSNMAEGYYRRYVKLGKIAPENDKDFEKELDAALAAGASHAEIINTLQRVMGETGYSALVRSFYRPESASSTPSPMTVGGTLLVPRSGENVTPEIARHKEMLLEAIRAAEADPFDDAGKIRNPLRYADFLDARKALRDIDITGVEIAKIENDLLAEIGFDWKEWQERMRNERDAKKEMSQEKKASLDSREAGDLEIKLWLALSAAIIASQKAAQKGEDPSDPLDDPKVKDIEERIRQRIDSGDENLDAVIRATENELLMSKRFNLEKLKAQAEAVRAERDKAGPSAAETGAQRKELKEAIEFGILDIARTPFGRRGAIRSPLENPRAQAAWEALRDAGVNESDIRQLQKQFYNELGFGWREWQERIVKERKEMNAGVLEDRNKKEAEQDKFIKTANLWAIADAVEQADLQDAAGQALSRRSDYGSLADEEGEEMQRGGEISDEDLIRLQAKRDADAAIRKGGGLPSRRFVPKSVPVTGKETAVNPIADKDDLELLREQEGTYREAVLKREHEEEVRAELSYEGGAPMLEESAAPESAAGSRAPVTETVELSADLPRSEAAVLKELEDARAWLAEVERKEAKFGAGELARAIERYDKARAEYVVGDIHKFVLEQTALFEKRAEITGSFEKIRKGWKWLGEMNLTKLGAKPGGLFSGIIYRGVNIRSVASGALLGLGALTPVGWLALGTRQVMSGVGAGFTAYELQRRWYESNKLAKLTDENIAGLMHGEAAERMIQLAAYARANHAWETVRPAYEKLQKRYEKDLGDVKDWLQLDPENVKDFTEIVRKEQTTLAKEERRKERNRRWLGVAAGFAAPAVVSWLRSFFVKDVGDSIGDIIGRKLGIRQIVVDEASKRQPMSAPIAPPGHESVVPPKSDIPPGREGIVPPVESVENVGEFKITFKSGEGPIHEARKAIALYLDRKGESLDKAERIWAEEELWKRTRKTLEAAGQLKKVYHPGDSIGFQRSEIDNVMSEVKDRFGAPEKAAALRDNLKQFVDNVKWSRYEVKGGRGLWEADGGIRKIVKIPVKALTGEAVDTSVLREALKKAEEVRQFGVLAEPVEAVRASGETVELHVGQYPAGAVTEEATSAAVESADEAKAAAGTAAENVDEAKTAAAEIVAEIPETVARQVSSLRKEYYDLIKNMEVEELLKKRYFSFTKEQQWPMPKVDGEYPWVSNKPSHVRLMQYLRFQHRVQEVIAGLSPEEAEGAKGMPVSKFIMKYLIAK